MKSKSISRFFALFSILIVLTSFFPTYWVNPVVAYTSFQGIQPSSHFPTVKNDGAKESIDPQLTITGIEEGINGASVVIDNTKLGDKLHFENTNKITGVFNVNNGVLTLRGIASAEEYEAALRSVQFSTTSTDFSNRAIMYNLGSALYYNYNGHYYEFVQAPNIKWTEARVAAEKRNFFGRQGYLATVTSQGENNFIKEKTEGNGWIGASDHYEELNRTLGTNYTTQSQAEGKWYWVTGPEAKTQFWVGNYQTGYSVGGQYQNWYTNSQGLQEPNNSGREDYAHILGPQGAFWNNDLSAYGQWNDFPITLMGRVEGYVVEYGGMPDDQEDITISTLKIMKITDKNELTPLDKLNAAKESGDIEEIIKALTNPDLGLRFPEDFVTWRSDLQESVAEVVIGFIDGDYENRAQVQFIVDLATLPLLAFDGQDLASINHNINALFAMFEQSTDMFPNDQELEALSQLGTLFVTMSDVDKEIFAYRTKFYFTKDQTHITQFLEELINTFLTYQPINRITDQEDMYKVIEALRLLQKDSEAFNRNYPHYQMDIFELNLDKVDDPSLSNGKYQALAQWMLDKRPANGYASYQAIQDEFNCFFVCTVSEPLTVRTNAATFVTHSSATVSGYVYSAADPSTIERGIIVSTSSDLSVSQSMYRDSTPALGEFTIELTGLAQETTYYYSAYATNVVGAVYGDIRFFTTLKLDNGVLDKSVLEHTIKAAEELYAQAIVGGGNGQYPQDAKDAFRDAIEAAETVLDNPNATQEDIDQAVQNVATAKNKFLASKIVFSPGSGSSSGSAPGPTKEEIMVDVRAGDGASIAQTKIERVTEPDGTIRDTVTLTPERAQEAVNHLKDKENKTARIVIPDKADQVSQVDVKIPVAAITAFQQGKTSLEIYTENVLITIPYQSFEGLTDDLYFRLIPIKHETDRMRVEKRAQQEKQIQDIAQDKEIKILGRPMTIETNMQSRPVTLILPLKDSLPANQAERQQILDNLVTYIEHSDGTKELIRGELVINNQGELSVKIQISKFSTFTNVYMEGWKEYFAALQQATGKEQAEANRSGTHKPYIYGFLDGTFGPEKVVTRSQMAALLARNMDIKTKANSALSFTDMSTNHWAFADIQSVNHLGLMIGYTDGRFGVEDSITRAQMAVILERLMTVQGEGQVGELVTPKYVDVSSSHWAHDAIKKAQASGLMVGYNQRFRPDQTLTRAEAVTVLNRLFQRGPLYRVENPSFPDVPTTHWAFSDIEEAGQDHQWVLDEHDQEILQ